MALTNNEKSICNKLVSDFDSLIQPGRSAKGAVNTATNSMKSKLNGMTFSDPGLLAGALDGYRDAVNDSLPGDQLNDLNELKGLIDNCDYLKDLNPLSVMIGAIGGVFDEIDNLINGLDLTFPEFGAGGLGSLVDKILDGINIPGGDKISDLLASADKLLNCLAATCAPGNPYYQAQLSSKSDELQTVYDDLGLVDNPTDPNYGKFDYSAMYNDLGMTQDEVDAINSVKGGINSSKDTGVNAINNTKNAIKQAKKIGEFF